MLGRNIRTPLLVLASLSSLVVACTHSTAVDGSEDAPEPDLPAASECADGVLEPGELCLVEHETPMPATILQVGDFDGDGNPDIATHGSSDSVSLWEGDGACGFSFRGAVSIPQTEKQGIDGPIPMLATLDDDGLTDLVTFTVNEGPGRVQAYVNDGDWGFVAQTESTMLGAGEPWSAAFAGDLDGDGLDEVLVEPVNTSGTLYILDYAAGQFEASSELVASADECWSTNWTKVPSYHNYTHGFVFTPGRCFDAEHSELTLILVEQGGDMVSTKVATAGTSPDGTAVGDFDGDGALEVLVFDRLAQHFELFRLNPSGGLDPISTMSFAELCPDCTPPDVGAANVQIAAGEFDGDPTDDLVLTFNTSMHVGLNVLAEAPTWVAFPDPGQNIKHLRVLDVDQDGADDVFYSLGTGMSGGARCLLNRY